MFEERIEKVKQLMERNKFEEAFSEYKALVLMVKRLDIDNFQISKKVKFLGDELILKILKKKLKDPIRIRDKNLGGMGVSKFYDGLRMHSEICNLIENEDYEGALRKFRKC